MAKEGDTANSVSSVWSFGPGWWAAGLNEHTQHNAQQLDKSPSFPWNANTWYFRLIVY